MQGDDPAVVNSREVASLIGTRILGRDRTNPEACQLVRFARSSTLDKPDMENEDVEDRYYDMVEEKQNAVSVSETQIAIEDNHNDTVPITEFSSSTTLHGSRDVLTKNDDDDLNQSLFFNKSDIPNLRIDYVLVFNIEEDDPEKQKLRTKFEDSLADVGVLLEREESSDGKLGCVKIHSPWDALGKGAKLLQMRKRIKLTKNMESVFEGCSCFKILSPDQTIVPEEEDFFTAPFDPSKPDNYAIENRDDFFTNAERSLITKLFLDSTECPADEIEGKSLIYKGIETLIHHKAYLAAFPLHEGRIKPVSKDPNFFQGPDKDRQRLFYAWAKPSNAFRMQPLDYVRKYFGEKIGLYFAWLGVYTLVLIPATTFGLGVFLYGLITLNADDPSIDVCNKTGPGNYTICPLCDNLCDFQKLSESCLYAKLTYVFDNYATVALAIFMSAWALIFLEIWKREQAGLQFLWDIGEYEADEKYRPGYEKNARKFKINPVTKKPEPYIPWLEKFLRLFTSISMVFFMITVVVVAIFAVLVYRLAVAAALFAIQNENAKLITTVTASLINLVIISVLGIIYKWLALFATKLEKHKTFSDHEDSYTFKIIVFQFINYYGSIIYIAYFKGSFIDPPGKNHMYVFGTYRQDQCDPTGCFIELTIQLAIIMIGKQAINGFMELVLPAIMNCFRRLNDNVVKRTRWEDDLDLTEHPQFLFFDEYLEMVIQFGFVTLFVTAFPLAPLFALINNVIEIRLDAYKAVKLFRRPPAQKAQDVGAWYPILRGFAYIAVITNAFIIAWTSEFLPKLVYIWNHRMSEGRRLVGYMDSSLSTVSTTLLNYTNDVKSEIYLEDYPYHAKYSECRFRGYFYFDEDLEYKVKPEYWQIFFARMAFVVVFEHLCFLVMSLISILIPDVSARVRRMRRYERQIQHRMAFEDTFTDVRDKRRAIYLQMAKLGLDRNMA